VQMSFDLPDIRKPVYDRDLTIQAVEDVFERYRYFRNVEFEEIEAKVTASYVLREGGHSGGLSDSTANIAVRNVDEPNMRLMFIEKVERCVSRLPLPQQKLIRLKYMQDEEVYDYQVYQIELGIAEGTFTKIRWKAIERLAGMLRVGVLKEKGDVRDGKN